MNFLKDIWFNRKNRILPIGFEFQRFTVIAPTYTGATNTATAAAFLPNTPFTFPVEAILTKIDLTLNAIAPVVGQPVGFALVLDPPPIAAIDISSGTNQVLAFVQYQGSLDTTLQKTITFGTYSGVKIQPGQVIAPASWSGNAATVIGVSYTFHWIQSAGKVHATGGGGD